MSPKGVVHVWPGQPSEFVDIAQWIREASIFNVLTSMNCFKNYLLHKMFYKWRARMRDRVYRTLRQQLKKSLFLARPSFCKAVLEVQRQMCEIQETPLLDASAGVKHVFSMRMVMASSIFPYVLDTKHNHNHSPFSFKIH